MGIDQQLGYEDDESLIQNSSLGFSGIRYVISEQLSVSAPVSLTLATNKESNVYSSYVGSLSAGASLKYAPFTRLSFGLSLTPTLHYYEYQTNKGGFYNPSHSLSSGFSVGYTASSKIYLSAGISNLSTVYADGNKGDDSYGASISAGYTQSENLSLGLSWSQRDRTFGYQCF